MKITSDYYINYVCFLVEQLQTREGFFNTNLSSDLFIANFLPPLGHGVYMVFQKSLMTDPLFHNVQYVTNYHAVIENLTVSHRDMAYCNVIYTT